MESIKRTIFRSVRLLGVLAVTAAAAVGVSACGNGQINWAHLIASNPTSTNNTTTAGSGTTQIPTVTQSQIQISGGGSAVAGTGVQGVIWINGTGQIAGTGVVLTNAVTSN